MGYVQERRGKWRAFTRVNGKVVPLGTFDRKAEAEIAAGLGTPACPTWGEWELEWQARRRVAYSTARGDETRLVHHVRPRWKDVVLTDIERGDIELWVAELQDVLSASSVRKCFYLLQKSLKAAVPKLIPANPCIGVELPPIDDSNEHWLTHDEADALRGSLTGFDLEVTELLLGTGARWGEGVAIHWDHVRFAPISTVAINFSFDRVAKVFKPTKAHNRRLVPMGERLERVLLDRLNRVGRGVPPALPYDDVDKPNYGLVLPNGHGDPFDAGGYKNRLSAAGSASRVLEGGVERRVGHVRPHDLRHTYASWLVQDGIPLQQVQKLLGHKSITTTERYAKIANTQWDAVRKSLG